MSEKKILSFDDLTSDPGFRYDEIDTPRGTVKVGTVSSADILDWFDENDDATKKRYAGLRLLVKSLVNPDGSRIGDGAADKAALDAIREDAVQKFAKRDSKENGELVARVLALNGIRVKRGPESPNASSEVPTGASPTASPSQPAE